MKKQFQHLNLFFQALLIITTLSSFAQQQFTHTATKINNACNGDCTMLDIAELNNKPDAILFVTPNLDNGMDLNPHPIGVYYFKNQWHIFNLDQRAIPANSAFNVSYYLKPDPNHFQYSITNEDLQRDGSAFINHPALNNNPNAQLSLFHSWVPEVKGIANRETINIQYNTDAAKWSVSNINKKPLYAKVTYNVVISAAGNTSAIPVISNPIITNSSIISSTASSASNGVTAMYMTAWAKGIQLPGASMNSSFQGKTEIIDFSMAANNPYDVASGNQTGKKIFEPITIKIETGFPPTIPLFNAFANGQPMVFIIEVLAINKSTGAQEFNYSIKLTGAYITSFKQAGNDESMVKYRSKYLDEIKIIFRQIEYIKDGVSVVGKE